MLELPKNYNSQGEEEIYKRWEGSGYFNPDICVERGICLKDAEVFSVMMPPPNVTGILHLGHAFENAILDTMTRYQRLRGKRVLFLPGTDHAAVATQARFERDLIESGKYQNPRQELGREKFLAAIRQFAEGHKQTILKQVRRMGSSCDWSRLAYTFDEERSKAVNEIFGMMYRDGLVYRGYRVVNWSVAGQSTCSDSELEYVERKTVFYTFRYSKDFPIPLSTTRPETKLGDTAIAVHPSDTRYQKHIGQVFTADVGAEKPLQITVIADETVDPEVGTGAVGVTPAHSLVDFEIYERQRLKGTPIGFIQVIGEDGKMTKNAGVEYEGLTVEAARSKFVQYLKVQGLIEKEEEITQSVGTSDRFKDIVEPIPKTQWFVAVNKEIPGRDGKTFKDLMREAVTDGHRSDPASKIRIAPDNFLQVYLHWLENLRDWCISRQIWWGHRIPVWYCCICNKNSLVQRDGDFVIGDDAFPMFSSRHPGVCSVCGSSDFVQDEDTLDTWFSSALWTFSTLGWPEHTKDLETFHPTSWMQMGYEILFLWMGRMILMSTYALDAIPFHDVYLHGLVRNEQGKKFSKSDKIVVDPLEMIAQHGADALRVCLIQGVAIGGDTRFYLEKLTASRNFVNKFWNIARFVFLQSESRAGMRVEETATPFGLADTWIASRFAGLLDDLDRHLGNWDFSLAVEKLREFVWHDLADWYLEIIKIEKEKSRLLLDLFFHLLVVAHPFLPFLTETLYAFFPPEYQKRDFLMVNSWPKDERYKKNDIVERRFLVLQEVVIAIRNLGASLKKDSSSAFSAILHARGSLDFLQEHQEIIQRLGGVAALEIQAFQGQHAERGTEGVLRSLVQDVEILCSPMEKLGAVPFVAQLSRDKQQKQEILELEQYIEILKKRLADVDFLQKAPRHVIAAEDERLHVALEKLQILQER